MLNKNYDFSAPKQTVRISYVEAENAMTRRRLLEHARRIRSIRRVVRLRSRSRTLMNHMGSPDDTAQAHGSAINIVERARVDCYGPDDADFNFAQPEEGPPVLCPFCDEHNERDGRDSSGPVMQSGRVRVQRYADGPSATRCPIACCPLCDARASGDFFCSIIYPLIRAAAVVAPDVPHLTAGVVQMAPQLCPLVDMASFVDRDVALYDDGTYAGGAVKSLCNIDAPLGNGVSPALIFPETPKKADGLLKCGTLRLASDGTEMIRQDSRDIAKRVVG
jgi:hypothetical protein